MSITANQYYIGLKVFLKQHFVFRLRAAVNSLISPQNQLFIESNNGICCQLFIGSCQAVIRQSSSSCQAVFRQLSGSLQAVVRQSSDSRQAIVRKLSVNCQADMKMSQNLSQIFHSLRKQPMGLKGFSFLFYCFKFIKIL